MSGELGNARLSAMGGRTDLAIARGEVRDGVAAIEHFLQVLGSRRVGPRVLARGIPEVLLGLAPLRAALTSLVGTLRAELYADPAGAEASQRLIAYAGALVDEIGAALAAREGAASIDARERLALEAVVRKVAGELGAFVRLLDLFGHGVTAETTTIDLGDALAQRRARSQPGSKPVLVQVDVRVAELTVGDARFLLDLLELAVATILRAGVQPARIVVEAGPEGFPLITVDGATGKVKDGSGGDGQILDVVMRAELPHEPAVVQAAARRAGITLTIAPDERTVTIAL